MSETTKPKPEAEKNLPSQALAKLAHNLGEEPGRVAAIVKSILRLTKKTSEPTPEELVSFCIVCGQYGLNPVTKEIAGMIGPTGQVIPIIQIDGWHKIVSRQPNYNGYTVKYEKDDKGKCIACEVSIYVKGQDHPATCVALYEECYRNTPTWNQRRSRMLFVRAYGYAARAAFGLGPIYDADEAQFIVESENATGSGAPDHPIKTTGNKAALIAARKAAAEMATPAKEPAPAEAEPPIDAVPDDDDILLPTGEEVPPTEI